MADLTNNDFIVFSEIPYLNAGRASHVPPLPNLKKNPALSKGEIRSPQSGEDLYAHNFLNVIDWYVASMAINSLSQGSESTRTTITSISPSFTDLSSPSDFFSNHHLLWLGKEDIDSTYSERIMIKKDQMPSSYQIEDVDSGTISSYPFFQHLNEIGALCDRPVDTIDRINSANELLASDFYTPFYSFEQNVLMLRNGCSLIARESPVVESWTESFSSDKVKDPQSQHYGEDIFTPYSPSGNGPYKNYRHSTDWDGSSIVNVSCNQTDIPVYGQQDIFIANSAYVHKENGTTTILKKTIDMVNVEMYVCLHQIVSSNSSPMLKTRSTYSRVQSSIGSLYSPSDSTALYLRLNPQALSDEIDSFTILDPASFASDDNKNISLVSEVQIYFFFSIKNIP